MKLEQLCFYQKFTFKSLISFIMWIKFCSDKILAKFSQYSSPFATIPDGYLLMDILCGMVGYRFHCIL